MIKMEVKVKITAFPDCRMVSPKDFIMAALNTYLAFLCELFVVFTYIHRGRYIDEMSVPYQETRTGQAYHRRLSTRLKVSRFLFVKADSRIAKCEI